MDDDTQLFCKELVGRFDELAPLLREHVADNDAILPHVFLGNVTRYILLGGTQSQKLVSFLNNALEERGDDIQNLIAISFVEHLESEEELACALRGARADALRREWRRQRSPKE